MRDESILADPRQQNTDLRIVGPRTVSVPATTWTQIAEPEPQRLALTIFASGNATQIIYSPVPQGAPAFSPYKDDRLPVVIHAAAYPLLVSGQWWAYTMSGQDVVVWDTVREVE